MSKGSVLPGGHAGLQSELSAELALVVVATLVGNRGQGHRARGEQPGCVFHPSGLEKLFGTKTQHALHLPFQLTNTETRKLRQLGYPPSSCRLSTYSINNCGQVAKGVAVG